MANFNTHLNTAVIITGLGSATLLSAGHIDLNSALWLWFLGSIGGLLPDIDSDNSTSLDTIFNLFAFSAVLLVLHYITTELVIEISFIELIIVPLLVYGFMKYIIRPIFEWITVHRGSCHSLLFLVLSALLTTQVTWQLNSQLNTKAAIFAWLAGGFVLLGGLIHLMLDEIYSVDLSNVRIKRSFGTALKVADFDNKLITLTSVVAIVGLIYIAPPTEQTITALSDWSHFRFQTFNFTF
ncbi:metal-dependent hydrolase [Psychromonas sp. 14N.309.X.WAT.B.A12]|uniref:metal-dependent hydrolase n=1 Tax=Psychromonas sp. 14N.309.X.WAT.B.A12 TaxID=2998322 RepID=UPI0025AEDEFF|nr:metal-dependent hydrolase [Psychromonas sp. 14N.309.X.WAT.B.A12]MDN2662291.1 metal-dependent hydrolase [Psychromonas sp. 14N.309.X.WAT.B.A12]